jgi:nucleoside-triphosphatase
MSALTQALLLTGAPGTGKTTIIREAIHTTKEKPGGFYTQEIREGGARLGFEIVTLDGSRAVLAHVDIRGPNRVGKYGVDIACLERVAIPTMHRAIQECCIVVVDEIGKMELLSSSFRDTLMEVLDSRKRLLGTITLQPHPFADIIKRDPRVQVMLVSRSNRQLVLGEVTRWLQT